MFGCDTNHQAKGRDQCYLEFPGFVQTSEEDVLEEIEFFRLGQLENTIEVVGKTHAEFAVFTRTIILEIKDWK
jgi:hypothetical protein